MSAHDGFCLYCGHPLGFDDRFCPSCGEPRVQPFPSWSSGAHDNSRLAWPTPSNDDPTNGLKLLAFEPGPRFRWASIVRLAAATLLTLTVFAGWAIAELRIVGRDAWPWWNTVWITCAASSVAVIAGWIVYGRRARRHARHHRS